MTNLPDALLAHVASYLLQRECLSFATGLASVEPSPPCFSSLDRCYSIILAQPNIWETLDLNDVQDIIGRRLSDFDIRGFLLCIDAVNKVKSLRLTNCVGIIGTGLEPLRGSLLLERIDLSLVGDHKSPTLNPEPPISVNDVVPILESIIGAEGNALIQVHLPKKWRVEKSNILTTFLQNFDTVLHGRQIKCSAEICAEICGENYESGSDEEDDEYYIIPLIDWHEGGSYGMNNFTCFTCRESFCSHCQETDGGRLDFCKICDKYYCENCIVVEFCQGFRTCCAIGQPTSCTACDVVKNCERCGCAFCPICVPAWFNCQFCDSGNICDTCADKCMNVCGGGGCNRMNCKEGDCMAVNYEDVECVTAEMNLCWDGTFCNYCRAKEYKKRKVQSV